MKPTPIGRFTDTPSYEELQQKVARLRLTDAEREAIELLCDAAHYMICEPKTASGLCLQKVARAWIVGMGLLERLAREHAVSGATNYEH